MLSPSPTHKMMGQNGGAAVTWSEVLIVAADDAKYWDKEVRCPAMLYLARGKRGGEPTAAYEEDPTGMTAMVKAQLTHGGKHAPGGGGGGGHPKSGGGKYFTTREGLEIRFTFAKNDLHIRLGPHRSAECGRANNQNKGGKGGKGK